MKKIKGSVTISIPNLSSVLRESWLLRDVIGDCEVYDIERKVDKYGEPYAFEISYKDGNE